jgi:glutamate 5-kinase
VGQIALSGLWAELLGAHGLTAAQLLLTLEDLEDRRRYLNATATLGRLLDAGAVPVINENDSVATQEIRFGDNDRLAARVAQAARASAVLLLSDVDGLYDRHPPNRARAAAAGAASPEVRAMASPVSGSGMGSGGMISKLQAAEIAELAGVALAIGNGQQESPSRASRARGSARCSCPAAARAGAQGMAGRAAAAEGIAAGGCGRGARAGQGASLLAAGITGVEGSFQRGDAVAIRGPDGMCWRMACRNMTPPNAPRWWATIPAAMPIFWAMRRVRPSCTATSW